MHTIRILQPGERFKLYDHATAFVSESVYEVGSKKGCVVCCHKLSGNRDTLHIHQDTLVIGMTPL